MKKRYAIGIDPGEDTGLAWYDRRERKIVEARTETFWDVYDRFAKETAWRFECDIFVETPRKTRLYERQDKEGGGRRREKIAANVGGNAREAELLADGLERLGYDVRRVVPERAKWTAKDLAQRTGIRTRTSQHVRDAIALVFGL